MEKLKRSIFFWTLVLLFFIVTPVVVLHARGYRFDMHRGVFVYSGTITFKSNPQSVNVSLNGESTQAQKLNMINSSYNLTGFVPGNYDINISADGFQAWDKKTDIHSGVSSEFWNVLLVRNNYEKTAYDATAGIDKFFISPQNKFIAYTQKDNDNLGVKIFNISNETTDKSFSIDGWNLIDEAQKENIEWSPKENYISVPVERDASSTNANVKSKKNVAKNSGNGNIPAKERNYFIINLDDNTSFNLNQFLATNNFNNLRWDPKEKGYLFFLSGRTLMRANISDASSMVKIADDVSAYDLSGSNIYYVQGSNNLVFRTSTDGQQEKEQITSEFPEEGKNISKIIIYDETRIGLISKDKNFYVYNKGEHNSYFRKIGENVEGMYFSDDGKKLLFWTDYEISVYFLRDWQVQPIRSENDLTNITRYSEPIKNVQWFKDYEHVIFSTGRWTKIIELDPRDHRNCMDLINTTLETPFIRYSNYFEKLYFTDTKDGNGILESIIFPEPTPILGIGG